MDIFKNYLKIFYLAFTAFFVCSCSVLKTTSKDENSHVTVAPEIVSYNELTMDLDPVGVTYTIDISNQEGRLKLHNISLAEARQLALVECLIKYNCATLFNPQYTHLKKGKDILRVTVYGFPARYKRVETEKEEEKEIIEEKVNHQDNEVTTTKTTTRQRTPQRVARKGKKTVT